MPQTINPATGDTLGEFSLHTPERGRRSADRGRRRAARLADTTRSLNAPAC